MNNILQKNIIEVLLLHENCKFTSFKKFIKISKYLERGKFYEYINHEKAEKDVDYYEGNAY